MPCKYGDLAKPAADILDEDYQTSGYQLKQKTNWDGAVVSNTVDLLGDPALLGKLSGKISKPFGVNGFSIDKLEMDKRGSFKFEFSADKELHQVPDLKLEGKSDLTVVGQLSVGFTWNPIKDALIKFETKASQPAAFGVEATYSAGSGVTLGAKAAMKTLAKPELGFRLEKGPLFAAVTVKELSIFQKFVSYKVSSDVSAAATYTFGGKDSGALSAGLQYKLAQGTSVKAKAGMAKAGQTVSCAVKHELSKGFTLLSGAKFSLADGFQSVGLQISIE